MPIPILTARVSALPYPRLCTSFGRSHFDFSWAFSSLSTPLHSLSFGHSRYPSHPYTAKRPPLAYSLFLLGYRILFSAISHSFSTTSRLQLRIIRHSHKPHSRRTPITTRQGRESTALIFDRHQRNSSRFELRNVTLLVPLIYI